MPVTIGALRESTPGETRVSLVPEVAEKFAAAAAHVLIERGAGVSAQFPDSGYKKVDWADRDAVLTAAGVLLTVQPPSLAEINALKPGTTVVGFMQAHARIDEVTALRDRQITAFAMELIPRISRAQSMDALSSQAAVAGYKAVLIAANTLDRFLPMLTTAAGTIRPAQVLIIGVGVAGLQAIATARRLGAVVEAYDVRSATKEQVRSARRQVHRHRPVGRRQRRLRARAHRGGAAPATRGTGFAHRARRRGDYHGRHPRQARAAHRLARGARAHEAGLGHHRHCGRIRRQLRADAGWADGGASGGADRPGRSTCPHSCRSTPARCTHATSITFLKPALNKQGELAIDWQDEVFAQSCLTHAGAIKHEPTAKLVEAS